MLEDSDIYWQNFCLAFKPLFKCHLPVKYFLPEKMLLSHSYVLLVFYPRSVIAHITSCFVSVCGLKQKSIVELNVCP